MPEAVDSSTAPILDARARAAEALLFAAEEPLSLVRLAAVCTEVEGTEVEPEALKEALDRLDAHYRATGSALRVEAWAGGYRLATAFELSAYPQTLHQTPPTTRLSRSLLETVAVLAYRQPATKPQVDFVRGVDSGYALRKLGELGLVEVVGRAEAVGQPLLYATTETFLDQFGLASLEDLPDLRELDELLDDPLFSREKARVRLLEELPMSEVSELLEEDDEDEEAEE